jgi:hypothetical protein
MFKLKLKRGMMLKLTIINNVEVEERNNVKVDNNKQG